MIERAARASEKAAADAGPSAVFNAANRSAAASPHTSASVLPSGGR
jgi:hypothetical protein